MGLGLLLPFRVHRRTGGHALLLRDHGRRSHSPYTQLAQVSGSPDVNADSVQCGVIVPSLALIAFWAAYCRFLIRSATVDYTGNLAKAGRGSRARPGLIPRVRILIVPRLPRPSPRSIRLKLMHCPHCRAVRNLVRHAFLYGYDDSGPATLARCHAARRRPSERKDLATHLATLRPGPKQDSHGTAGPVPAA